MRAGTLLGFRHRAHLYGPCVGEVHNIVVVIMLIGRVC